jgi:nucleoid DNA-binding protein
MSTATRTDLIRAVAERLGMTQDVTTRVIETFLEEMTTTISLGDRVELRGFFILETKMGKARTGRNPLNPEAGTIHIPPRPVLRFKAGIDLKKAVSKIKAEPQ